MTAYSDFVGREIVTTRVLNAPRDLVFSCTKSAHWNAV